MNRENDIVLSSDNLSKSMNFRTTKMENLDKENFIKYRLFEMFFYLGVPSYLNGFNYLVSGICQSCDNIALLSEITKELYPRLAVEFKTNESCIEQSIRHVIKVLWAKGNILELERIFGIRAKKRPSNSEFISMFTDKLLFEYKMYNIK